ncbi:MAG: type II toxin-antitoxin system antitoxin, RelB/DinJ family [Fusobacterium gastrosuis]|uniref:type II toxin-antitoxin system RelB/DinJ family antitoxin n=1 Tax=Fusobacterium gastrosuis TaxID=1755100 RepID=UPI002973F1FE|nr:type II toxin-antitoxin system antitoxin, RelB/DinJ family [Fusobacteriaceae bacterium]MDY4010698.1 type II toxin-antitoxin system antitoxin, RelB/DinJ family [Fusobacterium gastrosuis]MDY5713408.1 type II toxin-antitoxin system antitoxin, RelB/DinJ family [Fusobacterium gastrosuis]
MAKTTITFKMDENLKFDLEKFCENIGMSMSTFFSVVAKKTLREKRLDINLLEEADPFYNSKNINRLLKAKERIESGEYISKQIDEVLDYGN